MVFQFGYVWLSLCLINILFKPPLMMLRSLPRVVDLENRVKAFFKRSRRDPEQEALKYSVTLLQKIVGDFSSMLMCAVFGLLVPLLFLLLPLCFWINFITLQWVSKDYSQTPFDRKVATAILVNPPIDLFERLIYLGNMSVTIVVFVDMQFGVGPIIFYCSVTIMLITMSLLGWADRIQRRVAQYFHNSNHSISQQASELEPHGNCEIQFNPVRVVTRQQKYDPSSRGPRNTRQLLNPVALRALGEAAAAKKAEEIKGAATCNKFKESNNVTLTL